MEPSTVMRDHVLNPTAIYSQIQSWDTVLNRTSLDSARSWETSLTNPKNRIESLSPRKDSTWRLDGADPEGVRLFAIPSFALGQPPQRIDVFIPGPQDHPVELRSQLRSSSLPFVANSPRAAAALEISQHVLRALHSWAGRTAGFEAQYRALPFGSRIVVNEVRADAEAMEIVVEAVYAVEQSWATVAGLQRMWAGAVAAGAWPPAVDVAELALAGQPHESIARVTMPARHGAEPLLFKALVHAADVRYMYHELKMLLSVPAHPHLGARPLYVVTKKCRFGGKVGVCGFVLRPYALGSVARALAQAARGVAGAAIPLRDRLRWARQITGALVHINASAMAFYPDLKPDNVVLTAGSDGPDAVLIDLEQRGGWYSWSPPEVRYVEYMEYIAARVECPPVRAKSLALLRSLLPGWKLPTQTERYKDSERGFSAAWLRLGDDEREAAQVFMLGKLLWCLFEGSSSVNAGIGFDMFRDQEAWVQFPDFRDTPVELRECIRACTEGAPEWEGRRRTIVRRGTKYYPVERLSQPGTLADVMPRETQDAAIRWWTEEVRNAKRFIEQTVRLRDGSDSKASDEVRAKVERQARSRPSLKFVLGEIERLIAARKL